MNVFERLFNFPQKAILLKNCPMTNLSILFLCNPILRDSDSNPAYIIDLVNLLRKVNSSENENKSVEVILVCLVVIASPREKFTLEWNLEIWICTADNIAVREAKMLQKSVLEFVFVMHVRIFKLYLNIDFFLKMNE